MHTTISARRHLKAAKQLARDVTAFSSQPVNRIRFFAQQHPVICFYVIACAITWGGVYGAYFLLPASGFAFLTRNILPVGLPVAFALIGILATYGPSLAGLAVAGLGFGRTEASEWLGRWTRWRVSWKWYAVAFLSPPVLFVLQHLATHPIEFIDRLFLHPIARELRDGIAGFFFLIVLYFPYNAGEEGGWRGFALPHLQKRYGPIGASCLIGVMWEAWHLPQLLRPGQSYYDLGATVGGAFLLRALLVWILYSIVSTWIFNRARGSILTAALWHASTNATVDTERYLFHPSGTSLPGYALGDWLLWPVLAIMLIWFTRGRLGYDHYLKENKPEGEKDAG